MLVIARILRSQYEELIPDAVTTDIEMLLLTTAGKVRTQQEIQSLVTRASLTPKPAVLVGTERTSIGWQHKAQVIEAT